jgi:hypothetical protein
LRNPKVKRLTRIATLFGLALATALGFPALAADPPRGRLPLAQTAPILPDGLYTANDQLLFYIDHSQGQVRLKFADSDEVFYLSNEPGALGGRVLKYDTGDVALVVAGWGGVTLYTGEFKGGVPVDLSDVTDDLTPEPVAPGELKNLAMTLAQELAARDDFAIGFAADWDALAHSESARALAVDAMRNTAYALHAAAKGPKRSAIAEHLHQVRVTSAAKSGASLQNGALVIDYAPRAGASARPSSLAVARVLDSGF